MQPSMPTWVYAHTRNVFGPRAKSGCCAGLHQLRDACSMADLSEFLSRMHEGRSGNRGGAAVDLPVVLAEEEQVHLPMQLPSSACPPRVLRHLMEFSFQLSYTPSPSTKHMASSLACLCPLQRCGSTIATD